MDVIGIDFAPRYSAFAVLDSETGELLRHGNVDAGKEGDGLAPNLGALLEWATSLRDSYSNADVQPLIVVEDVSHFMSNPGHGLRLQGAFRAFLWEEGFTPEMVYPQTWQKFFGWRKTPGTTSKGFATFACAALGYYDLGVAKGKASEDVHDAILIARWKVEQLKQLHNSL